VPDVALHDLDAGVSTEPSSQDIGVASVQLDRDHTRSRVREGIRDAPATGADLQDEIGGVHPGLIDQFTGDVRAAEEVPTARSWSGRS
jgi:hypothetical protein